MWNRKTKTSNKSLKRQSVCVCYVSWKNSLFMRGKEWEIIRHLGYSLRFAYTEGEPGLAAIAAMSPSSPLQLRISYSACLFVARRPHSYNPLQHLIGTIWIEKHVCRHTSEQPSNQAWVDSSWLTCFPLLMVCNVIRDSSFWLEANDLSMLSGERNISSLLCATRLQD